MLRPNRPAPSPFPSDSSQSKTKVEVMSLIESLNVVNRRSHWASISMMFGLFSRPLPPSTEYYYKVHPPHGIEPLLLEKPSLVGRDRFYFIFWLEFMEIS